MESTDSLQQQVNELTQRVQVLEQQRAQDSQAQANGQSQIELEKVNSDLRRKEKEEDAKRARQAYYGNK